MIVHWIWLAHRPSLTDYMKAELLRHFSDPEDIYFADPEAFSHIDGLTVDMAKALEDKELTDAEAALEGVRLKVPEEETDEICELCGRNMVIKMGRFGKFLACPGWPECKNAKPLVERMPGRCPKCGSSILKRKSKRGYAYYGCEKGAECGFMTWDVPTAEDCPQCGQTMIKKSGRGRMKSFCINEACSNFLPEDKRGYYKKKTATEGTEGEPAGEPAAATPKKSGSKKAGAKKSAPKKTKKKEAGA